MRGGIAGLAESENLQRDAVRTMLPARPVFYSTAGRSSSGIIAESGGGCRFGHGDSAIIVVFTRGWGEGDTDWPGGRRGRSLIRPSGTFSPTVTFWPVFPHRLWGRRVAWSGLSRSGVRNPPANTNPCSGPSRWDHSLAIINLCRLIRDGLEAYPTDSRCVSSPRSIPTQPEASAAQFRLKAGGKCRSSAKPRRRLFSRSDANSRRARRSMLHSHSRSYFSAGES